MVPMKPGSHELAAVLPTELRDLAARLERLEAASPARTGTELQQAIAHIARRCDALVEVSDLVYQDLTARLDRLEAELAHVRDGTAAAGPTSAGRRIPADAPPASYVATVARVRDLVVQLTPPGATVAVVSKGDPALIELDDRVGWHFPRQADGRYLGYYPKTDADAVALLEEARVAGAEYVVFPSTSLWWLEHYRGLSQHLQEHAAVVVRDATTATIFRLARPSTEPGQNARRVSVPGRQVRELVDRLVPAAERIAVAADDLAPYHRWMRTVVPFPAVEDVNDVGLALDHLRAVGVGYVVVPRRMKLDDSGVDLCRELAIAARTVIDQRHLCAVFKIEAPGGGRTTDVIDNPITGS